MRRLRQVLRSVWFSAFIIYGNKFQFCASFRVNLTVLDRRAYGDRCVTIGFFPARAAKRPLPELPATWIFTALREAFPRNLLTVRNSS